MPQHDMEEIISRSDISVIYNCVLNNIVAADFQNIYQHLKIGTCTKKS